MKVLVIGGGASGMIAALAAVKNGADVTLVERQSRVGRKLLATGNGRCNLTNLNLTKDRYHGENADFVISVFDKFNTEKTIAFFEDLGLLTVAEDDGKVYPLSDQAGSVLDVLRLALDEAGVEVKTDFDVKEIRKRKHNFKIHSDNEIVEADRVIVCCGGMASGKLGGTKSGYELLGSLGHTITKLYPSLVQLKTDTTFVKALKGVRADGEIILKKGDKVLAENTGEIQFTEYGVSGPVVFEISRAVATTKGDLTLSINLLRKMSFDDVCTMLFKRRNQMPNRTMENFLTGMVHNRLGRTILRYAGYGFTDLISSLEDRDIKRIAKALQNFELTVTGNMGFDSAQVTAGGIRTNEFDSETMESLIVKGVFAAGEVLDIDGDCGGFNLQWAWASGFVAGKNAVK